jgi:type IV pilus assembly protein PilV
MKHRVTSARRNGFSLVEVMVALIVISVGLLGVTKMQALALSNTASARLRTLASLQSASLGSAMHADRAYWAASLPAATVAVSSGVATSPDATLQGALAAAGATNPATNYCTQGAAGSVIAVAPCTPVQMAAADLQNWAADLFALMPNSSATITCDGTPLTCTVTLNWVENLVGANATSAAVQNSTYVLYVQP